MKQFAKKLVLFSLPFWAYAALVVAVDPYNYFHLSGLVPEEVKERTAGKLNSPMFKMIEYRRHPVANLLLGDSRMGAVKCSMVKQVTGSDYYNFFYGGASLREILNTFWFADSLIPLRNVYVGINFNLYNDYVRVDRTEDYRAMAANLFLYFVNPTVLRAMGYIAYNGLTGRQIRPGLPPMSHEQFWDYQLRVTARDSYLHFRHPDEYARGLANMAAYCRRKNIRLVFIVFPTHVDLQSRVVDFKLEDQERRFRDEIASLAPTYDYDHRSALTANRQNFEDPYHFRENVTAMIVRDVWGPRAPSHARSSN